MAPGAKIRPRPEDGRKLPYEQMRLSPDPESALLAFLQTTYEAAANCANWDRVALEVSPPPTTA